MEMFLAVLFTITNTGNNTSVQQETGVYIHDRTQFGF